MLRVGDSGMFIRISVCACVIAELGYSPVLFLGLSVCVVLRTVSPEQLQCNRL